MSAPSDKSRQLIGVVVGSSVAATPGGWAFMLADVLKSRGWQILNVAENGFNTIACKSTLLELVSQATSWRKPDLVIVGLSLYNEGLTESPIYACKSFIKGMQDIMKIATETFQARVVLGGVYPCGLYEEEHYKLLKQVKAQMETWKVPLFDFLTPLDDGHGRWDRGTELDELHPNLSGHKRMFQAIDLTLFDKLRNEILGIGEGSTNNSKNTTDNNSSNNNTDNTDSDNSEEDSNKNTSKF